MRKLLTILMLAAFVVLAGKPILSTFIPALGPAIAHASNDDDDDQGEDNDDQ